MRSLLALCGALPAHGIQPTLVFHHLSPEENNGAGSVFPSAAAAKIRRIIRGHYGLDAPPGVRAAVFRDNAPGSLPALDYLISTTWKSAEQVDCLPVDAGIKLHVCGLEPEHVFADMRARAALHVTAIKIRLSRDCAQFLDSEREHIFTLPGHDPAADLARILKSVSGEHNRQYWFRRRFTGKAPAPGGPLRVLCITAEHNACAQIRIVSPLNSLCSAGVHVRYHFVQRGAMVSAHSLAQAHVIVFQRVRDRRYRAVIQRARAAGKKVLFEIDDNLFALPEEHMFHKPGQNNARMRDFMKRTQGIIVTNKHLAEYLEQSGDAGRVRVFPNYIDTDIFDMRPAPRERADCVTVGYSGSVTHNYEFAMAAPALLRLAREYGGRLRLVFLGYMPDELKDAPGAQFIESTGSYHVYAHLLRSAGMDIALAPLKRNLFNSCKSNIKYLEYAALGIAGAYSGAAPYADCITHGRNGLIVNTEDPDEWYAAIKALIDDPALRAHIAHNAKADVLDNYTITKNASKLIRIYEEFPPPAP